MHQHAGWPKEKETETGTDSDEDYTSLIDDAPYMQSEYMDLDEFDAGISAEENALEAADMNDVQEAVGAAIDEEDLTQDMPLEKLDTVLETQSDSPIYDGNNLLISTQCSAEGKRWTLDRSMAAQSPDVYLKNFQQSFRKVNRPGVNAQSAAAKALFARAPIPMHCQSKPQLRYKYFCHEREPKEFERVWKMQNWKLEQCDGTQLVQFDPIAFVRRLIKDGGLLISGDSLGLEHFTTLSCALGEHLDMHVRTPDSQWKITDFDGRMPTNNDFLIVLRLRKSSSLYDEFKASTVTVDESTIPSGEDSESISLDLVTYMREDFLANHADFTMNLEMAIKYPDMRFRAVRESIKNRIRLSAGIPSRPADRFKMPKTTEYPGIKHDVHVPRPKNMAMPPLRSHGVVVINSAAHWIKSKMVRPDELIKEAYQNMVNEFVALARSSPVLNSPNPKMKLFVRTQPPANVNCWHASQPAGRINHYELITWTSYSRPPTVNRTGELIEWNPDLYDGAERFSTQHDSHIRMATNHMWKDAFDQLYITHPNTKASVRVLDVTEYSFLRPDTHGVLVDTWDNYKRDCSHICVGGGVLEEWVRDLYVNVMT